MPEPDDRGNLPYRETRDLIVQTFLASLPFGGGIAMAWSSYTAVRRLQRIEELLADLKAHLNAIGEKVDLTEEQQKEIPQLLEEVLDRAERETREEKAEWLRAFLAGALLDEGAGDLSKRLALLRLLDSLVPAQLFLLVQIRQRAKPRHLLSRPDAVYVGYKSRGDRLEAELFSAHMRSLNSRPDLANPMDVLHLPVDGEWIGLFVQSLEAVGVIHTWDETDTARLQRRPQYRELRGCCLTSIGREFLDAFAFSGSGPVFGPPWDAIHTARQGGEPGSDSSGE
jgi:hypothetical protein